MLASIGGGGAIALSPMHHVSMSVSDLDRSVDFYTRTLGLRQTLQAPIEGQEGYLRLPPETTGRMVMLQADDTTLGMIELVQIDIAGVAGEPKRPGDPGVWMICFEVVGETMEEACARIASNGVSLWADINEVTLPGYPPFRVALLEDPDGLLIELLEAPSRDAVRQYRQALRDAAANTPH